MTKLKPISDDLNGCVFGKLTVVDFAGYLGTGGQPKHAHWNTICECGNTRVIRATRLIRTGVDACAACSLREGQKKSGRKKVLANPSSNADTIYGYYRGNATKRGLKFEIDKSAFRSMIASECFYCGAPPSTLYKPKTSADPMLYNGVDRRNNSAGYNLDNAVPCCSTCNYAKRDMTEQAFLSWVERVAEHQRKSRK
jgi:hypothetical protein